MSIPFKNQSVLIINANKISIIKYLDVTVVNYLMQIDLSSHYDTQCRGSGLDTYLEVDHKVRILLRWNTKKDTLEVKSWIDERKLGLPVQDGCNFNHYWKHVNIIQRNIISCSTHDLKPHNTFCQDFCD